jgi:hypothetical protein
MTTKPQSVLAVAGISISTVAFALFREAGAASSAFARILAGCGLVWTLTLLTLPLWRAFLPKFASYALLVMSLAVLTCAEGRADGTAKSVTYANGRLSNNIVLIEFV